MSNDYDLVVLGGGIGGYSSAIRASQLGMKVAVVEKDLIGGTCLHKGCIPSKTYLKSAEIYQQTKNANDFGIEIKQDDVQLNFKMIKRRKDKIVETLYKGLKHLMKKHKIEVFHGHGRILGPSIFSPLPGAVSIEYENKREHAVLTPKHVLIATGSQPKTLENIPLDHPTILNSNEALEMESLPQSIMIIGGGVIGIEWASMLVDFGLEVTVIEQAEEILPTIDKQIAKGLRESLERKGVKFLVNASIITETIETHDDQVTLQVKKNEEIQKHKADKMLLAIGRKANYENIGINNTNIIIQDDYIEVNEFYQTEESHIYAIGDVIGGMQLAHVALHEGLRAVEHMAHEKPWPISYKEVPQCIYSDPEVASVGYSEQEAKRKGYQIAVNIFPFQANGKAMIEGKSDGFVKMISDKETEDLLGIHMIGPKVTEMISEGSFAKLVQATPWEMAQNIYPHPSLSEVIGEVAMGMDEKSIHG